MDISSTQFWLALLEIIWVNILLSGDNAVVIALAVRSLPVPQQRTAIVWGSAAAIVLRILLTLAAAELLLLPWLKVVGALLLVYIGVSLLLPESGEEGEARQYVSLWAAIRTILVADLIMSLDNVVAVAAAAHGDMVLLVLGLAISIPIVVFGSTLLLKVIERLPIIVWLGAALLGYIAGEMVLTDPALLAPIGQFESAINTSQDQLDLVVGIFGATLVLVLGRWFVTKAKTDSE